MDVFKPFDKIPRLNRDIVITEKIDGTNAQVLVRPATQAEAAGAVDGWNMESGVAIADDGVTALKPGSRNRWVSPGKTTDNYGFAAWVVANRNALVGLGFGTHFGEWYGQGIQHGYGLKERRWALFNVHRWTPENPPPACCEVVPVLYKGQFNAGVIDFVTKALRVSGSVCAPGAPAEGVIVFHVAGRHLYKVTCENDAVPKSAPPASAGPPGIATPATVGEAVLA